MPRSAPGADDRFAAFWKRLAHGVSRFAAAGLIFTSCACSTVTRPAASDSQDPFLTDEPTEATPTVRGQSEIDWQSRPAGFRPAARPGPAAPRSAIQQVSAEVRMPLGCPPTSRNCPANCSGLDERYPDEYLCDGGDRGLPVHYSGPKMLGLESEDTVVEFENEDGKRRVQPANKVCIYSPRFASIVSVSGAVEDVGGGRPVQAVASVRGMGLKSRDVSVAQNQNEMTERLITRSRGSGLKSESATQEFERPETIQGYIHTMRPLVSYGFLKTGMIRQREGAWLAKSIQSAAAWTRDQNPAIAGTTDSVGEIKGRFTPDEYVGRENRFNGKGKLRIVKLADKEIAAPGDVITFKIRFDNIGDREVGHVVIADNLTPRLEYVEDSATCDKNGQLRTEENGEGSLILRWELDDPLPGRSGGVVTFQARVR
jgi:uncharacterized repeat protein (TIGR01451 family)